jgi:hypothetical protein
LTDEAVVVVSRLALVVTRRLLDRGRSRGTRPDLGRSGSVTDLVLALQRAAGNRAVAGAVAAGTLPGVPMLQRAPGATALTGQTVTSKSGVATTVTRVVGLSDGYEERWMATAVARLTKTEPAATLQRADTGRWYAVEVSAPIAAGQIAGVPGAVLSSAYGLPSLAGLAQVTTTVAQLKARLGVLKATKPQGKQAARLHQDELSAVVSQLNQENVRRMALVFGVADSEVNLIRSKIGKASGRINVIGAPDLNSPSGSHGPVAGQKDLAFHPDLVTAIDLNEDKLDDPARAQATLFHEAHHLKDIRFAQDWVRAYQKERGALWISGSAGVKPFQAWLAIQVTKKRLTAGDAQLVVDESVDVTATTEARANIHTFLTVLQLGDANQAATLLRAYARALPPVGTQYGAPPAKSPVTSELVSELKTAYRTLPTPLRAAYRSAVKDAVAANPTAWIKALTIR